MVDTAELLSISKVLEKRIDQTVNNIFNAFYESLLEKDNTYVIPAIWGVMEGKPLDDTQVKIHQMARQAVNEAIDTFNIQSLTEPQAFAIRYLINRNIIYTMTYKIETAKNLIARKKMEVQELLKNMPPSGTA